jgi:hypothetical protein
MNVAGSGETINICSSGVLCQLDPPLEVHSLITLSIHWPVALNDLIPLDLVIHGTVIRVNGKEVAVKHEKHGFFVRPDQ